MRRSSLLRIPGAVALLMALAAMACQSASQPADTSAWSCRVADTYLARHPGNVTYDSLFPSREWNYEQGLMVHALLRLGEQTGDRRYRDFVEGNLLQFVDAQGVIRSYDRATYNLDNIAPGRAVLELAEGSHDPRWLRAADSLREQLRHQPRTQEGGFWHKKIYPYQMWLDGLFMAEPFYALYAVQRGDTAAFEDIVNQFVFVHRHTLDRHTGLLYHGWDERRVQRWADSCTGVSPHFWGRAMGWYLMALVDVLDILPPDLPRRGEMLAILQAVARSVRDFQDPATGVWFQIVDEGNRAGNYREASASCMFAYAFARGAHAGYLDSTFLASARTAFAGILREFVVTGRDGGPDLLHTCRGAGLGGNPYRDGSFAYYVGEPQRRNDLKGLGPFLLAAMELERASSLAAPKARPRDSSINEGHRSK